MATFQVGWNCLSWTSAFEILNFHINDATIIDVKIQDLLYLDSLTIITMTGTFDKQTKPTHSSKKTESGRHKQEKDNLTDCGCACTAKKVKSGKNTSNLLRKWENSITLNLGLIVGTLWTRLKSRLDFEVEEKLRLSWPQYCKDSEKCTGYLRKFAVI